MISQITSKDKISFLDYCLSKNTIIVQRNNEEFDLTVLKNINIFFNEAIKRNKILLVHQSPQLNGFLSIDKDTISFKVNNKKILNDLLRIVSWNVHRNLNVFIEAEGDLFPVFKKYKFSIIKRYGNKLLLKRTYRKR